MGKFCDFEDSMLRREDNACIEEHIATYNENYTSVMKYVTVTFDRKSNKMLQRQAILKEANENIDCGLYTTTAYKHAQDSAPLIFEHIIGFLRESDDSNIDEYKITLGEKVASDNEQTHNLYTVQEAIQLFTNTIHDRWKHITQFRKSERTRHLKLYDYKKINGIRIYTMRGCAEDDYMCVSIELLSVHNALSYRTRKITTKQMAEELACQSFAYTRPQTYLTLKPPLQIQDSAQTQLKHDFIISMGITITLFVGYIIYIATRIKGYVHRITNRVRAICTYHTHTQQRSLSLMSMDLHEYNEAQELESTL